MFFSKVDLLNLIQILDYCPNIALLSFYPTVIQWCHMILIFNISWAGLSNTWRFDFMIHALLDMLINKID